MSIKSAFGLSFVIFSGLVLLAASQPAEECCINELCPISCMRCDGTPQCFDLSDELGCGGPDHDRRLLAYERPPVFIEPIMRLIKEQLRREKIENASMYPDKVCFPTTTTTTTTTTTPKTTEKPVWQILLERLLEEQARAAKMTTTTTTTPRPPTTTEKPLWQKLLEALKSSQTTTTPLSTIPPDVPLWKIIADKLDGRTTTPAVHTTDPAHAFRWPATTSFSWFGPGTHSFFNDWVTTTLPTPPITTEATHYDHLSVLYELLISLTTPATDNTNRTQGPQVTTPDTHIETTNSSLIETTTQGSVISTTDSLPARTTIATTPSVKIPADFTTVSEKDTTKIDNHLDLVADNITFHQESNTSRSETRIQNESNNNTDFSAGRVLVVDLSTTKIDMTTPVDLTTPNKQTTHMVTSDVPNPTQTQTMTETIPNNSTNIGVITTPYTQLKDISNETVFQNNETAPSAALFQKFNNTQIDNQDLLWNANDLIENSSLNAADAMNYTDTVWDFNSTTLVNNTNPKIQQTIVSPDTNDATFNLAMKHTTESPISAVSTTVTNLVYLTNEITGTNITTDQGTITEIKLNNTNMLEVLRKIMSTATVIENTTPSVKEYEYQTGLKEQNGTRNEPSFKSYKLVNEVNIIPSDSVATTTPRPSITPPPAMEAVQNSVTAIPWVGQNSFSGLLGGLWDNPATTSNWLFGGSTTPPYHWNNFFGSTVSSATSFMSDLFGFPYQDTQAPLIYRRSPSTSNPLALQQGFATAVTDKLSTTTVMAKKREVSTHLPVTPSIHNDINTKPTLSEFSELVPATTEVHLNNKTDLVAETNSTVDARIIEKENPKQLYVTLTAEDTLFDLVTPISSNELRGNSAKNITETNVTAVPTESMLPEGGSQFSFSTTSVAPMPESPSSNTTNLTSESSSYSTSEVPMMANITEPISTNETTTQSTTSTDVTSSTSPTSASTTSITTTPSITSTLSTSTTTPSPMTSFAVPLISKPWLPMDDHLLDRGVMHNKAIMSWWNKVHQPTLHTQPTATPPLSTPSPETTTSTAPTTVSNEIFSQCSEIIDDIGFCLIRSGQYKNPADCRSYFVCDWGSLFRCYCPRNTMFDDKLNVCNWDYAVTC